MKKQIRQVALLLAMVLLTVALMSGCGEGAQQTNVTPTPSSQAASTASSDPGASSEPASTKPAEHVTLKMYLLGDKAKDFDLVYGEINKLLKEDINATLEVSFMSWSDYQQKYPLVFASGEDFDLIYSANWCFYNAQAVKGAYKEITKEMLAQYAPMTAASMYPDAWEQAKVNGKVYMLPMNYKELNPYTFMVRGDLMEKYGISDIKSIEDFGKYLDAVAKNEPGLIPCDIGSDQDFDALFWCYGQGLIADKMDGCGARQTLMGYDASDASKAQLFSIIEQPGFAKFVKMAKEWKDKGYWSKSALVNQTNVQNSFINGKSASAILNVNTANGTYITSSQAHPEWKIKVYDAMFNKGVILRPYIQNGMSIYANSKNVERSLMLLDLFKNDQRYADLVTYGIKGKHYDLNAEGNVIPLADTGNFPIDGNCNWGWRDDKLFRQVEGGIPNYAELKANWEKVAYAHPLQFFNFDDSNVKNEFANATNIFNANYKALIMGFTEDPEGDIQKLIEKYKAAGLDKIMQEAQSQVDTFLSTFGK